MAFHTFKANGFIVDVDDEHPLVNIMLNLPEDKQWTEEQWVQTAIDFLGAYMALHPLMSEEEAIGDMNRGATWLFVRRDAEAVA